MSNKGGKGWEWVLNLDPDHISSLTMRQAYHLDQECTGSTCKRNCTQKPKCIYNLGERRWLTDQGFMLMEDLRDVDSLRREMAQFTGLKNLGATCYVNSLLQLLFHNPQFRKAIYLWDPRQDPKEQNQFPDQGNEVRIKRETGEVTTASIPFHPRSAIGQLQRTFVLLQFGRFNFVDPSDFVRSLDLDENQQQDAQEFCKLFLNVLEEDLATQSHPYVRQVVQNEFRGEYSYITRCHKCNGEKLDPSKFYELSLNMENCKKLEECLSQFFAPETLEGSNSYNCAKCGPNQKASRRIGLTALPPTLNVQLLRFVYDRSKKARRKINTEISFPEILDMAPYIKSPSTSANVEPGGHRSSSPSTSKVYHLRAVLLHFGKTCGAGHYVAQIKDATSNAYYKFNDEKVERIEAKRFKKDLVSQSTTEDPGTPSSQPVTPAGKRKERKDRNRLYSQHAYMLVYHNAARENECESTDWQSILPPHLNDLIREEGQKFNTWVQGVKSAQETAISRMGQKCHQIRKLYGGHVVCRDPTVRLEMVHKEWLQYWLKQDFPKGDAFGGVIDNRQLLCSHNKICLSKITDLKCTPADLAEETWQGYERNPRLTSDDLCRQCVKQKITSVKRSHELASDVKAVQENLRIGSLNSTSYYVGIHSFKNWKELANAEMEWQDTQARKMQEKVKKEKEKSPSVKSSPIKVVAVPSEDVKPADESLGRIDSVHELIEEVPAETASTSEDVDDNSQPDVTESTRYRFNFEIICDHGNLTTDKSVARLVPHHVWRILAKYFKQTPVFEDSQESCPLCRKREEELEIQKKLSEAQAQEERVLMKDLSSNKKRPDPFDESPESAQSDAPLTDYVLSIKFVKKLLESDQASSVAHRSIPGTGMAQPSIPSSSSSFSLPSSSQSLFPSSTPLPPGSTPGSAIPSSDSQVVRRSDRLRKDPDQKEITVSSQQTLKDLKVRIMKLYNVPTYDQHLTLNGRLLEGNDMTLAQHHIFPNASIELRVDEPSGEQQIEERFQSSRPETGFKGTLLSR